jgi:hypothetical protein
MTQTETYRRALEAAKQASGKDRGAASWLARHLGVDRQTLFYWSNNGFPPGKVDAVAKLIGIDPTEIRMTTVEIPISAWKSICERVPKRLTSQATILK